MAFVLSNEGELLLLKAALGHTAAGNLKLKLYKTNVTPAGDSTTASFTVADFTGYSTVTLTASSGFWATATAGTGTTVGGSSTITNKAKLIAAEQTFTMGTPGTTNTVYGYYITDNAETTLIGAELFGTAKSMAVSGDAIKITPQFTFGSE